ncbi:DMT family transporter [Aliikangiella coralliicola]|uniref:DMT family transporter n=1 Tax=Aliikangiella coralliicola TaxID=2592383 RepID=A0A545UCU6_9GAMM|nr:DMT family transporter [Aliikangiella coralliicola]TQV87291.1 DMT family transporter [Aliikangiella coralliicola]
MKTDFSVSASYLLVVLIWSTTPLGIVWSSESVDPTMAVLLRMLIAAVLGTLIIKIRGIDWPTTANARRLYCYSGFGIFGGMFFTYLSATYLPSGVISLIFGLAPIFSSLFAQKILGEAKHSSIRKISLALSLVGLTIVFSDGLAVSAESWPGLIYILLAVILFSYSAVLVKTVQIKINPIATTVGALWVTIPFFVLAWLLLDGELPISEWQSRAIIAIIYLGIFGSLIGFVAYYYILQKLAASVVALITLMTPVLALAIGAYFNDETISYKLVAGAGFVILGLILFNWGDKFLGRSEKARSS